MTKPLGRRITVANNRTLVISQRGPMPVDRGRNKMAKNKNVLQFVAIVGVLGLLAFIFIPQIGPASVVSNDGGVTTLGSEVTPDVTVRAYDTDNVGTALTETTNSYRVVGDKAWTTFTQGATLTSLQVGATYEFLMGVTAADDLDNAYGSFFTYNVKAQEADSIELAMANDEIETSLSSTFYNNDNDAAAETFTTGQTQTVSIKFVAGSDEYFGNPFISGEKTQDDPDVTVKTATNPNGQRAAYPNIVCMDLNSTAWDKPEGVTFNGVSMNQVPQPQRHTSVSTDNTYCYEAPVITDSTDQLSNYFIRLNADDSSAPAQDDTLYIYAAGYYINGETGNVEWGVEDEEGNAVATDASDSVTLDFTA